MESIQRNNIHASKQQKEGIQFIQSMQLRESTHSDEIQYLIQQVKQKINKKGSDQSQGSKLVSFQILKGKTEQSFLPSEAGLLFVFSGAVEYQIGDDEYHALHKGEYLLFPKGINVNIEADKETLCMFFYLTKEIIESFIDLLKRYSNHSPKRQYTPPRVCIFQQEWSPLLKKSLTKLLTEYVAEPKEREYFLYLALLEMLHHIFSNEHMLSKITYLIDTPYFPEAVQKAERYLLEHYYQPLRSKQLAEAAMVSESQLNRLYKKYFGISPMERVAMIRMEQAGQLLRNSSLTVTHVAEQVGYQSMSAFVQQFKRKFGVSPKEYQSKVQDTSPKPV